MKVGKLDLSSKAILAPMMGITDSPFRKLNKEYGAGLSFTEMVSALGVIENEFRTLRYLAFSKNEKPVGIQFLGNNPDYLYKAVKEVVQFKPDVIDLNCGCPVQKVCKWNMGAALLDQPSLIGNLVKKMVNAAGEVPVSVKMRLGKDKSRVTILENAKVAEDNGASFITVHAKVKNEKAENKPVIEWLRKVKETISIPVVANGFMFTPQDCLEVMQQTGCDNVLIARGAIGNPFIFSRLNALLSGKDDPGEPSFDDIKNAALKHLHLIFEENDEDKGLFKVRKNMIWYFMNYNGIYDFIQKIYSLNSRNSVEDYIAEHTEMLKQNVYPEEDREEIKKVFLERVLFWMNETGEVELPLKQQLYK